MDSAIVTFCRKRSCKSSCDAWFAMVEELLYLNLTYFCCFECNRSYALVHMKGRSRHVSSVVAAASITIAPLPDFTNPRIAGH